MAESKNLLKPAAALKLIRAAMKMRARSYCPYSSFSVGAALLTEDGSIYTGCNIENAAYSGSICAERTAFVKALSEGERHFKAIAIVGGKKRRPEGYSWPCGECRQFMREFCDQEEFVIVTAKSGTDYKCATLAELLPESFGPGNLV